MIIVYKAKRLNLGIFALFLPIFCYGLKEERNFKATKLPGGVRWNFELRNRTADALWVQVRYADENVPVIRSILPAAKPYLERHLIKSEQAIPVIRAADLDLQKPVIITIETARHVIGKSDKIRIAPGKSWRIEPSQRLFDTVFLSFEKGELRPQKGSFGKTQSGLSIEKNIKVRFIQPAKINSAQAGKVFAIDQELDELNEDLQKSGMKEVGEDDFKKGLYGFRQGEMLSPSQDK